MWPSPLLLHNYPENSRSQKRQQTRTPLRVSDGSRMNERTALSISPFRFQSNRLPWTDFVIVPKDESEQKLNRLFTKLNVEQHDMFLHRYEGWGRHSDLWACDLSSPRAVISKYWMFSRWIFSWLKILELTSWWHSACDAPSHHNNNRRHTETHRGFQFSG